MDVQFQTGDGRRVVIKRAATSEEAARLRREADLLEVAGHPGLVEVVRFDDGPQPTLCTSYAQGESVAREATFAVEEAAGIVAAVASTLADLHALGMVHGAVAPEHVLIERDGRPVLCSLGYGGLIGERLPEPPAVAGQFVDPNRSNAEVLDPTFDVFGLGAVLAFLVASAGGRARGAAAEALHRIAGDAMAAPPAERPTARALADAVHDAIEGARLPGPVRDGVSKVIVHDRVEARRRQQPLERWRRTYAPVPVCPRRRRAGVFAAVGVAALGAAGAVFAMLPGRPEAPPQRAATPPSTAVREPPPTTVARPSTTGPSTTLAAPASRPPAPSGCPDVDGPLSADVDGDGCPEAVRWLGGVVEAGALRWAVGQAGDVITVGDWTCSGGRTLAVLRPETGQVFAFSGWASRTHEARAPLVAEVAGGQSVRAADIDGDGCNELVVERTSGGPAVVSVPRGRR